MLSTVPFAVTFSPTKALVTCSRLTSELNLDGDWQADLRAHGGRDKAVFVYSSDYYEYWKKELPRDDLRYGNFGETSSPPT